MQPRIVSRLLKTLEGCNVVAESNRCEFITPSPLLRYISECLQVARARQGRLIKSARARFTWFRVITHTRRYLLPQLSNRRVSQPPVSSRIYGIIHFPWLNFTTPTPPPFGSYYTPFCSFRMPHHALDDDFFFSKWWFQFLQIGQFFVEFFTKSRQSFSRDTRNRNY